MTKENRFEGLMGVVGKNKKAQTSKSSDVSTSDQLNIQTSEIPKDDLDKNVKTLKRSDAQTSKSLDVQTSKKAKSVNPDYTRTTLYLPKKMHKKLKAIALEQETEMSSIVEELIEGWLNSQS